MPVYQDQRGKYFIYDHVVSFEETNVVGNVYYANHVLWQGHCREMFLYEFAPTILDDFKNGVALVTLKVACEYLHELYAFDKIQLRMRLGWLRQNRMQMLFEYYRIKGDKEELIARGEQQTACLQAENGRMVARPFPDAILERMRALQIVGAEAA